MNTVDHVRNGIVTLQPGGIRPKVAYSLHWLHHWYIPSLKCSQVLQLQKGFKDAWYLQEGTAGVAATRYFLSMLRSEKVSTIHYTLLPSKETVCLPTRSVTKQKCYKPAVSFIFKVCVQFHVSRHQPNSTFCSTSEIRFFKQPLHTQKVVKSRTLLTLLLSDGRSREALNPFTNAENHDNASFRRGKGQRCVDPTGASAGWPKRLLRGGALEGHGSVRAPWNPSWRDHHRQAAWVQFLLPGTLAVPEVYSLSLKGNLEFAELNPAL